jgi:hypothetical protein
MHKYNHNTIIFLPVVQLFPNAPSRLHLKVLLKKSKRIQKLEFKHLPVLILKTAAICLIIN